MPTKDGSYAVAVRRYGVSNGRTDERLLLLLLFPGGSKQRPSLADGGLELKLAVVPVRAFELGAGCAKHGSEDPAACTDWQLVDHIVAEH